MIDRPVRILLVEDNPGDARLIREMFAEGQNGSFHLEHVDRLASALERSAEGGIDVVLLDLGLPDSQGFATFASLQQHVPTMPIVVLSGLHDETLAIETVQHGAQDYLVKGQVIGNLLVRAARYAIERKRIESTLEMAQRFLAIGNRHAELAPLIEESVTEIRRFSRVAAVGIRILDHEGRLPYLHYEGFSSSFCGSESPLSVQSDQRMCINVIKGATDPKLPFYTPGGSFYVNSTTRFLATLPEGERERTCDVCHQAGYESVALIPIRLQGHIYGLIHLADPREGLVPLERVQALEGVATTLGMAMQRMRTEERLAQERYLVDTLLEHIPDNIYFKDVESRFIRVNRAMSRYLGVSDPAQVVGKTDRDFFDPEHAQAARDDEQEMMASGQPLINQEEEVNWPDGRHTYVSTTKIPLYDREGKVIGTCGISRDITERKRLGEQLRQSQKMEAVGRLAGGVAHDFNNLLTVIQGHAEFALATVPSASPAHKDLKEVLNAAQRATNLTRQLLAFSRRQVLEPRVLDLNQVLREMGKMLPRLIGEDIELRLNLAQDLGSVKVDPGQIEQVVVNLVVNARDAMPQGGTLTIETANITLDEAFLAQHLGARAGQQVVLVVSDSGCGMTPEVKAHLFEPFFTTKGPGKGTGLGLATIYGIVKQSDGNIYVYSEPGQGTAFRIYFPRVDELPESLGAPATAVALPRGTETILLVEDDVAVRLVTTRMLRSLGYKVLEAPRPDDVLYLFRMRSEPIHVVFTDVVMPGLAGPELVAQLRQVRQDFRVLYMSGYTDEAVVRSGALASGAPLLQKPFTIEQLALKLRQVLDENAPPGTKP